MEQIAFDSLMRNRATVLIVGGGFVAGHLIDRLEHENVNIRLLTRHRPKHLPPHVQCIAGDFHDRPVLRRCLSGVQAVYHLASPVGKNWQDYMEKTVAPAVEMARLAAAAGVDRFFYTSSIDLHDSSQPYYRITGETPADPDIRPRNHYARAKAACEAHLRELHRTTSMSVTIFRLGMTIGTGGSPAHRGVGHFRSPTCVYLWGNGANRLPFVLADDAADALVLAMSNPRAGGKTLLVCAPPALTAKEYADAVAARVQVPVSVRSWPIGLFWAAEACKELIKHLMQHPNRRAASLHDWQCRTHRAEYDPSATMRLLGWRPTSDKATLIARGINPAVDEFINHRTPEKQQRVRIASNLWVCLALSLNLAQISD